MSSPLLVANTIPTSIVVVDAFKSIEPDARQTSSIMVQRLSEAGSSSSLSQSDAARGPTTAREDIVSDTAMKPVESVTLQILHIIESYGLAFERTNHWDGLDTFIPSVRKQVQLSEPIRLLLPGFPFKSPNTKDKVLGELPDLGEEIALAHLNSLGENIRAIYPHGADIHICSDGLVYNDLLGVPDESVWDYGEAVRSIATARELKNLKFIRLWDLLEHDGHWNKDYYLVHASCIRQELQYRYGDRLFKADMAAKTDEDVQLILASYVNTLKKDLAYNATYLGLGQSERDVQLQGVALEMMRRWKAFATAIQANRNDYVRLSIHDSSIGKGKLSMSLVPQSKGVIGFTPWHSCIAIELDGSYRTVHPSDVTDKYELISKDGRLYGYRARSELFDWSTSGLEVSFEHLYPCGLIIRPVLSESEPAPSMRTIPGKKVRDLSNNFSPVVLRGFSDTKEETLYRSKGDELGQVLSWNFGEIFKVVDTGEIDKNANNVTSNEAMPMHFDGCFKFVESIDPATGTKTRTLTPPGYQYFTCISTAPKGTGYTLFCNSRLFFRHLSPPWSVERLEPVTWQMENDGFWSNKQTELPLVKRHSNTGQPCLRWHQPWSETKFSKYKVTIENEEQDLVEVVNTLIYDYRVCLRFTWAEGDLLVNDNVSMLHTRTSYESKCDREMWRIHFD